MTKRLSLGACVVRILKALLKTLFVEKILILVSGRAGAYGSKGAPVFWKEACRVVEQGLTSYDRG